MSDRELLELAAKAGGITGYAYCEYWEVMAKGSTNEFLFPDENWDPLTDDGDALRLAVILGLTVRCDLDRIECVDRTVVTSPRASRAVIVENWSDKDGENRYPSAATRRAIVRAAAEIGRTMP